MSPSAEVFLVLAAPRRASFERTHTQTDTLPKLSGPSVHQALVKIAKLQCDDGSWHLSDELAAARLSRIASTLLVQATCTVMNSLLSGAAVVMPTVFTLSL